MAGGGLLDDGAAVCLPPIATIRDISGLREAVLELLRRNHSPATPPVLDCSALQQADLSTVQLVVAARAMARRDGITLRVVIPPDGVLATLIHQSGLDHEFADLWR